MDIQILRKVIDTFKRLKSSALKSCCGHLRRWSFTSGSNCKVRGGGEGRGHPDPEKRGAVSQKNFFWPCEPQFGLKIGGVPPGPSPGSATGLG